MKKEVLENLSGPIILQCLKKNPAMKFYERLGFLRLEAPAKKGCVWLYRGKSGLPLTLAKVITKELTRGDK